MNIEYSWVHGDQKVFFISKDQYTEENIENFYQLNSDKKWYLAIAIDGFEAINTNPGEINLALYQQGYFDMLLNRDYEIVPYKRKYFSPTIINKITTEELKNQFAYNDKRLKLYNDYVRLMNLIQSKVAVDRISITGSYLEDKENPNDIDVVLEFSENEFKRINQDPSLCNLYMILINTNKLKEYGFDVHVKVMYNKEINLEQCNFNIKDRNTTYLCQRGYFISLFTQKTIYHDNGYDCYIRNLVRII